MTTNMRLLAAFVLAANAATVLAQQPTSARTGERPAAQPQDCVTDNRPRHGHGMEMAVGPAGKRGCEGADKKADNTSANSGQSPKGHDHGKFHKGQ